MVPPVTDPSAHFLPAFDPDFVQKSLEAYRAQNGARPRTSISRGCDRSWVAGGLQEGELVVLHVRGQEQVSVAAFKELTTTKTGLLTFHLYAHDTPPAGMMYCG